MNPTEGEDRRTHIQYKYIYMYINIYIYICIYIYIHMNIYNSVCTYKYICTGIHIYTQSCIYIYICIYIYECIHSYIYIYILNILYILCKKIKTYIQVIKRFTLNEDSLFSSHPSSLDWSYGLLATGTSLMPVVFLFVYRRVRAD